MKQCPVCKRRDLTNGLVRCPQCNADLECFDLLDKLQEQPAAVAERSDKTGGLTKEMTGNLAPPVQQTRNGGLPEGLEVLLILVLIPLLAYVGSRYLDEHFDRLEDRLAAAGSRTGLPPVEWSRLFSAMQTLTTRLEGMEQRLSDLTEQQARLIVSLPPRAEASGPIPRPVGPSPPSGLSAPATPIPESGFTDYHAASAETLWGIARRFYGKGIYYPVLLEDNPGLAIYGPPDGQTIRIARQPEHARETYRRLVYAEGGKTLFRYRAKAGDSWRSLARAFYGSERRAKELAGLNGRPQPETGQRVLVPLD